LRKDENKDWIIVCAYNSITRFGVPTFVLLSGTFFLNPEKSFTFRKLIKRNIFRLVTAFLFWSVINVLIHTIIEHRYPLFSLRFIGEVLLGEEYEWFILMIIGCYLTVPFLRQFSNDVLLSRYFLGLWFFWTSFLPTCSGILRFFVDTTRGIDTWVSRWHYHFTVEYIGYFVAGYYLIKHVNIENAELRNFIYIIGIIDVIFIVIMTLVVVNFRGTYSEEFRGNFSIFVVIYSCILFLFFKFEVARINFSEKAIKIISKLSSLTFGMYLSHLIIRNLLSKYLYISQNQFLGISLSPLIGCPLLWVIVSALSLLTSYIISLIPVLRNYII